jgi:hypothetical protein
MRIVFVLLQLAATLRRSFVVSGFTLALLAVTVSRWTHSMHEWQDHRDGYRYYVSQAASDETSADIDAQAQAIMDQCGVRIDFQAEKRDDYYREQKKAECEAKVGSYRRVAVTRQDGMVSVTAKVKCRCDESSR